MTEYGLKYNKELNAFVPMDAIQAELMCDEFKEGEIVAATLKRPTSNKLRTIAQNNSLYLWCERLGKSLNDGGLDMRRSFEKMKEGYSIPWTKERVKEYLFDPVMRNLTGKTSSAKLDTKEISEVYEIADQAISSNLGVHEPWPNAYDRSFE